MLCFRDMTFCNSDCTNLTCHRKLTDQVSKDAKKWWGGDGAPIAMNNFSSVCEEYKND